MWSHCITIGICGMLMSSEIVYLLLCLYCSFKTCTYISGSLQSLGNMSVINCFGIIL